MAAPRTRCPWAHRAADGRSFPAYPRRELVTGYFLAGSGTRQEHLGCVGINGCTDTLGSAERYQGTTRTVDEWRNIMIIPSPFFILIGEERCVQRPDRFVHVRMSQTDAAKCGKKAEPSQQHAPDVAASGRSGSLSPIIGLEVGVLSRLYAAYATCRPQWPIPSQVFRLYSRTGQNRNMARGGGIACVLSLPSATDDVGPRTMDKRAARGWT